MAAGGAEGRVQKNQNAQVWRPAPRLLGIEQAQRLYITEI
jgi:hypothetical protein